MASLTAAQETLDAVRAKVAEEPDHDADLEVIYDEELAALASRLDAISADDRAAIGREYGRVVHALDRRRRSFRRRAERARRQQIADRALIDTCGSEAPERGPWDGEIVGSERFMRQTAHDPGSIDVEQCTPPQLIDAEHCWTSRCIVRGNNAFGARVASLVEFDVARNNTILRARTIR